MNETITKKSKAEMQQEQDNFNRVAAALGLAPQRLYSPVSRTMKRYAQMQNGKRVATLSHAELEKMLRLDGLTTTEEALKRGIRLADGSLVKDTLSTGHHEITE
jgi:DNA polymerase II large subunit